MSRKDREKQIERRIKLVILLIGSVGALLQGIGTMIQSLK